MKRAPQSPGHASDDDATCPVPIDAAPPSAEYVSSFLLHIHRRAADDAATTAASVATALAASPRPPGVTVAFADGAARASPPKRKRNRRGSGSRKAQYSRKKDVHTAACSTADAAKGDRARPSTTPESGDGMRAEGRGGGAAWCGKGCPCRPRRLRLLCCLLCSACFAVCCYCMTAGRGATEVYSMLHPGAL